MFENKILVIIIAAAVIIKAINESKDVQALSLEGNTLGVEAAQGIAEALSKRPEFEVNFIYGFLTLVPRCIFYHDNLEMNSYFHPFVSLSCLKLSLCYAC